MWSYFVASLGAYLSLIYYAFYTHRTFFPTILFLVTAKISFVMGGNLILAAILVIARVFKSVFFTSLRDQEVELLVEKAKYFITETCLALTIFRNELDAPIMALFTALIFVKLFHRLAKCRAEYLEQIMPISRLANFQISFLFLTLFAMDLFGLCSSVTYVLNSGKSVVLLFGFESGLLMVYAVNSCVRYLIHTIDANSANGLPSKGLYIMIIDLICEVIKFITYLFFFSLILVNYGVPLHIMRGRRCASLSYTLYTL